MNGGVSGRVVDESYVSGTMANREYIASFVCVLGFVPSWLCVSVLMSSVWVVNREMRSPSKSLARVSFRYIPL